MTTTLDSARRSTALLLTVAVLAAVFTAALPARTAAAAPVSLDAFRNNTGIAQDPFSEADFDGSRYSYSSLALRLEGLVPGDDVTAGSLTYTWPETASGDPDNVGARGQTIPVDAPTGTQRLGFLGAATNGPITGTFLLNYSSTDAAGVEQTTSVPARLTFSDWTLNAGTAAPSFNNTVVATTPFRLLDSTWPELVDTNVFAVSVELDPAMSLTSVTLPDTSGKIHLFAMSIG